MKILLVHTFYQQPGGEDVVFRQEVELLRRCGHSVATYTRSNEEIESYSKLEKLAMFGRVSWNLKSKRVFAEVLRTEQPDIVHVHNTFIVASPSIFAACKEAGVPVINTLHNFRMFCPAGSFFRKGHVCEECLGGNLSHSITHACYRDSRAATATVALMILSNRVRGTWTNLVDRYIVLSEFARRKFIEGGLPAEKITVKPNFVDPDPGLRTGNGEHALFVGRVSPEKGLQTLIDAWKQLKGEVPLRILGDGPFRAALEAQVVREGIQGITFVGRVPRERMFAEMKNARFLVFPSVNYESFPMTIVEAYACGVPIIASCLGSTAELIGECRTGITFSPGDATDLADKVAWAWSHPKFIAQLGTAAREEYESKYTAEVNSRMLLDIYESALKTSSSHEVSSARLPMPDIA